MFHFEGNHVSNFNGSEYWTCRRCDSDFDANIEKSTKPFSLRRYLMENSISMKVTFTRKKRR